MPTVFGSVSIQTNHNDSGVFVLQLLLTYDGKTHFHFKEERQRDLNPSGRPDLRDRAGEVLGGMSGWEGRRGEAEI